MPSSWGFDPTMDRELQLLMKGAVLPFDKKEILYIHARVRFRGVFWIIELRNYRRFLLVRQPDNLMEAVEAPTDMLCAEIAGIQFERKDIEYNLKRQLKNEQEYDTYEQLLQEEASN